MTVSFPIEIQAGKIVTFDRQSFQSRIKFIGNGKFFLHISKDRPSRSTQQNRYLWGCVYDLMSKDTGYTADEIHQIMAEMFLGYEKNGKRFVRSTTTLSTVEMEDYLEKVRRFAATDLNIFIPLPNEAPA